MNKTLFKTAFSILLFLTSCSKQINERSEKNEIINEQEIKKLVSTLSWDSFIVYTNYAITLKVTNKNASVLENKGKMVTPYLINALKDKEKTVIAHIILTNIWEPEVNFINYYYCIEDPFHETHYQCLINNLKWYMPNSENNLRQIDEYDQDRIYKYWNKRTNN